MKRWPIVGLLPVYLAGGGMWAYSFLMGFSVHKETLSHLFALSVRSGNVRFSVSPLPMAIQHEPGTFTVTLQRKLFGFRFDESAIGTLRLRSLTIPTWFTSTSLLIALTDDRTHGSAAHRFTHFANSSLRLETSKCRWSAFT